MAWEEAATSKGRQQTVALTQVLTEPRTTHIPTRTTAAPLPYWLPVEAERAGSGRLLRGTAPPREAAGCWRGHLQLPSLQRLQQKGAWKEQAEVLLLISLLETAAPTV